MKLSGSLLTGWIVLPALLSAAGWIAWRAQHTPADAHAATATVTAAARTDASPLVPQALPRTIRMPRPVIGPAPSSTTSWSGAGAAQAAAVTVGNLAFEARTLHEVLAFYMSPYSVTVGDITGDGRDDIALLTKPTDNAPNTNVATVLVFRQTASGDFLAPIELKSTYLSPYNNVALGDLDRDGDLEIVAASSSGLTTYTYRADGTFGYTYSYGISDPFSLQLMDVDRDGHPDAVTRGRAGGDVFYGDGLGGFPNEAQLIPVPSGADFSVGDVTADGLPDIVASDDGDSEMRVVRHAEITGYGFGTDYPHDPAPYGVTPAAIGDFNGDGLADIAYGVGREVDPILEIRQQDPTRTLGPAMPVALPGVASTLVSADLDGNGATDLAMIHGFTMPRRIGIMLQGPGGLEPMVPLEGLVSEYALLDDLAIGQLSPDGCRDIVVLDGDAMILLRRSNCFRAPPIAICRTQAPERAAAAGLSSPVVAEPRGPHPTTRRGASGPRPVQALR